MAERAAHAEAIAIIQAELLMTQTCTVEQLQRWAATIDKQCPPSWIAYELTCTNGSPWWVGHMFYVEQRWLEVAQSMGLDGDTFRPMRGMFEQQYHERCAAQVRQHFKFAEAA